MLFRSQLPEGKASTISVRLPDGRRVTFAFCGIMDDGNPCSVDIFNHDGPAITAEDVGDKMGGDQLIGKPRQRVNCFSGGGPDAFLSERADEREKQRPVTLVALRLDK